MFGLGDSSYPKYNWVGRKLFRRLTALGAHPVVEKGEGDDQNEFGYALDSLVVLARVLIEVRNRIESTFPTWLEKLFESIDPLFPTAPGFTVLSPDTLSPPRIRLTPSNSPIASGSKDPPPLYPWTKDGGWATVKRLERFTGEEWFQDVRNLELEIEGGTSSVVSLLDRDGC